MVEYRDRCKAYVPEGLYNGEGRLVEIGRGPWNGDGFDPPELGEMKHGLADELNREQHWKWVKVSRPGEPEHWSHFEGHVVQVDIELHTHNSRTVNDWKGRDEVRGRTEWSISLNRRKVYSGEWGSDVLETLLIIRETLKKLLDHPVLRGWTAEDIDGLVGRRVIYHSTPAVIARESLEHQGRIVLEPDGADAFPPPPWSGDDELDDPYERRTVVTTILDPAIWWWRE